MKKILLLSITVLVFTFTAFAQETRPAVINTDGEVITTSDSQKTQKLTKKEKQERIKQIESEIRSLANDRRQILQRTSRSASLAGSTSKYQSARTITKRISELKAEKSQLKGKKKKKRKKK